jgi:hypothetical protein
MTRSHNIFVGIDVSGERSLVFCALTAAGQLLWAETCRPGELHEAFERLSSRSSGVVQAVGIDGPRMFPRRPRRWAWRRGRWTPSAKPLAGRHCEVAVRAIGLADPDWTPIRRDAPAWMLHCPHVYRDCAKIVGAEHVHEVNPKASRRQLAFLALLKVPHRSMIRPPRGFPSARRDALDAMIAAWTVALHETGCGSAIGGGDDAGSIVIPGDPPPQTPPGLLSYPTRRPSPARGTSGWSGHPPASGATQRARRGGGRRR